MKALFNIKNNINSKKEGLKNIWQRGLDIKKAGFTLIEMMIVLAIFAVITSVAMFNQTGLNSSILLTNLAYETALAVREAQTYGIGVRATAGSGIYDNGYGAYFDTSRPNNIFIFNDLNSDHIYTESPSELQSLYTIANQRGNKISWICYGAFPCQPEGILIPGQKISIMFKRPNPEATFWLIDNSSPPAQVAGPAVINITNYNGTSCKFVIIEVTGQIRVQNSAGNNCTAPQPA
jgi:prepilin-type N-terminal cleavage/methylation domain-containing protein